MLKRMTMTVGRRRFASLAAAPLLLCIALPGCNGAPPPPTAQHVPVAIATAQLQDVPVDLTANGRVEPIQTVSIEPQVNGVITEVAFHEGDDVQVGQVLFRIDARPYEAALRQSQGALARDLAQAVSAETDAKRFATLAGKDFATRSEAEKSQATAAALHATVQADSAAVEAAQLNLSYCTIRAPVAGRTGSLLVHLGNVVRTGAGTSLVVINQLRPILVRFAVPQRELGDVQKYGTARPLVVTALPAEGQGTDTDGALVFIDNKVDGTTGTVTLKAKFDNAGAVLWPGQFITVRLRLYTQTGAVTVPPEAVVPGQNGNFVFVVDSTHKAHMRKVVAGRTTDTAIVIDQGVQAGEQVVTDGQSRLFDGATVDIRVRAEQDENS